MYLILQGDTIEDATRLFYSNEQVANYNHEQLTKLEHPIAHINARHSSALAKKYPQISQMICLG